MQTSGRKRAKDTFGKKQERYRLLFFHHIKHNKSMKVVEKDKVISGMLRDQLKRCQEMLDNLEESISEFPKGAISKLSGMRSLSDSMRLFPAKSECLITDTFVAVLPGEGVLLTFLTIVTLWVTLLYT